ncbi:MAG TPA: hypothetical protein DD417_10830, partial [Elusimicrobia bacterium]|nr:hypothetical protein [Elusimicrobiota bacterium]
RDGGKVTIGEKSPASLLVNGNVGIGTTNPQAALDVSGVARFGNFADSPKSEPEKAWQDGSLYYDTTKKRFLGLQDGNWKPLGGDGIKLGESANYPASIPPCSPDPTPLHYGNNLEIYNGKFMIRATASYIYSESGADSYVTLSRFWDGATFSDCETSVSVTRQYADAP